IRLQILQKSFEVAVGESSSAVLRKVHWSIQASYVRYKANVMPASTPVEIVGQVVSIQSCVLRTKKALAELKVEILLNADIGEAIDIQSRKSRRAQRAGLF